MRAHCQYRQRAPEPLFGVTDLGRVGHIGQIFTNDLPPIGQHAGLGKPTAFAQFSNVGLQQRGGLLKPLHSAFLARFLFAYRHEP